MTEQQTQELINAIENLTYAVETVFHSKGQMGYTIADSLEAIALEPHYREQNKKKTPSKVHAAIDAITKNDKEAIADGWDNIPLDSIKK
tara:strand:- start:9 stop:275 length:267 start_codon:yes stop_codon:yes gene_type:complete